jgi:hypothetical protein
VSISGYITFDEDRHVRSAATLMLGDRSGEAGIAPPGFDDDNELPQSFDAAAGKEMRFGGNVIPSCPAGAAAEPLVLDVTSTTGDGPPERERLPLDVEGLDSLLRMFCDGGVQAAAYQGGVDAEHGEGYVRYTLLNPGPGPVTVTSEESSMPSGLHWQPAAVELPAGVQRTLMVRADGTVHCGTASPSALGLLHATDGSVVRDGQQTICNG